MNQITFEAEEFLSDLTNSRILISETSDEDSLSAVRVELGVDGTSGEDGHGVLGKSVVDVGGTVLGSDGSEELTGDDDVHFSGTGMDVRGVEATGADETHGDGPAIAHECGEGEVIRADRFSSKALHNTDRAALIHEVEEQIALAEEVLTSSIVGSEDGSLVEGGGWRWGWPAGGGDGDATDGGQSRSSGRGASQRGAQVACCGGGNGRGGQTGQGGESGSGNHFA